MLYTATKIIPFCYFPKWTSSQLWILIYLKEKVSLYILFTHYQNYQYCATKQCPVLRWFIFIISPTAVSAVKTVSSAVMFY